MMKATVMTGCLLICAAILAVPLIAQESPPAPGEGQMPEMDEATQKMMEMWMKAAAPGEHHAHLKKLAGDWRVAGKFRMAPDAPWTESKSESHSELIMDGRFLVQKVKGEPMMGMPMPFEGFGVTGYDNMKQKYQSVWMDNMGTMMMISEGTSSADGSVITYTSKMPDPMTGTDVDVKMVCKIESPDKNTFEMLTPGPDGKEFVTMELTYTR